MLRKNILFLFLFFVSLLKGNTIFIDKNFTSKVITKSLSFAKDYKEDPYFNPNYLKNLKFSQTTNFPQDTAGKFWIKIPIENKLNKDVQLTIETNRFHEIELFYFNDNHLLTSIKGGLNHPFSSNHKRKGDLSILDFIVRKKNKSDFYLWVNKPIENYYQYSKIPITLKTTRESIKNLKDSDLTLYFFLGAIILMTLYNLALFFVIRKSAYLYYIANNIFIILFVLGQTGKLDILLFNNALNHEKITLVLGNLSFIFYMMFGKTTLKFKKYDPKWNSIVNYALLIWPFFLVFVFIDLETIAVALGSFFGLVGYFIILYSSVKAIRNGSISIKYFLIGNVFYFTSIVISILQLNNILPYQIGPFTGIEIVEIGTMIQLALFSLTLGSSINIIKRKLLEKEIEQQRLKQEEQIKLSQIIQKKNIELEKQVIIRTNELEENSKLLEIRNQDITDSLNYARRIQDAFLPDTKFWNRILPKSFLIYLPKEVISGDFYWAAEQNNRTYFAVADCTGHGIPGAMVSIVGVNSLHRCINEYNLEKPSKILDKLNALIEESFEGKSNKEAIQDGMDISLCSIYEENGIKVLEYAGANNPLWIIRQNEFTPIKTSKKITLFNNGTTLYEIAPDKQPIGKHIDKTAFTNNRVELFEGDDIYLFTDGFIDQFGGEHNKKFKLKNFRELVALVYDFPKEMKKNKILSTFRRWKNKEDQVDDVCVANIRI